MEAAVVIIGIVALVAVGLSVFLLWKLISIQSASQGQASVFDHQVGELRQDMGKVGDAIHQLGKEQSSQSVKLETMLTTGLGPQLAALNANTGALREALANTQVRGQWGERMAEDVFRIVGFVEQINYVKQTTVADGRSRPDFTIYMPDQKKLNMDAKFPFANYLKCLEAVTEVDSQRARQLFIKDVRDRAKEVVGRDYINPDDNTLDYVLVFIPNEQMYHFIQQHASEVVDEALRNKVVLCSPISLFAILGVVRHALDSFAVQQASKEIVGHLGTFNKQWKNFVEQMDKVGDRIGKAQQEFDLLEGRRRRALERPLDQIEAIRQQQGIALPDGDDGAEPLPALAEFSTEGE